VKVFERILEVAAESEEVRVGVGVGVVSCRLLAEKIGKNSGWICYWIWF
jgi:hypothetical protein